ncbi:MAG: site-specific DNA-methyltransferase [Lachnospiraceae bacterium]|nr:site-specific DNA-methyltransferase [Lachnospiraceae bacterium]
MDKMRMESVDMTAQNIEKIEALFPNCITETADADGKLRKAVNFDILRQMLSKDIIESDEAYEFTWVGKKASIVEANKPLRKTLRPCPEESVNWDTTENLYIEGDNLEALKLIQESYLEKVKMIYIDPPYNTGNDFIYRDDFKLSEDEYEDGLKIFDEEGNRLFKNTDTNGRFHSDWCSMLYSRLMLARNLLTEDGVIFISIDDHEQENAKKICGEIFGESNFVAELIWERAFSPKNDAKFISNSHDYVLMYAKNIFDFTIGRLPRTEEANARYSNPDNDPRGVWMSSDISVKTYNAENDYPITAPSGRVIEPPTGRCWSLSQKAFWERLQDNRIWFGPDGDGVPRIKRFLTDLKHDGMAPTSIMFFRDVGHSQEGSQEVTKLLGAGAFDGPKPIRLMRRLLTLANLKDDSVVLDFFSGSASTAHAVIQNNAENRKNCKFIMIQIPQECDEKGEAYQAGYRNICEIGKERIRRAGKKVKEEINDDIDYGFRVLKIDDSNMRDVYYSADDYNQQMVKGLESNIKEDRTDLDLLFGCLLEWGLPLSLPYSSEKIDGCTVHNYNNGDLIACFDENISKTVVETIARRQPLRAVFRDSSFPNSPAKINVGEIFKLLAPDTRVKVI